MGKKREDKKRKEKKYLLPPHCPTVYLYVERELRMQVQARDSTISMLSTLAMWGLRESPMRAMLQQTRDALCTMQDIHRGVSHIANSIG
jgi:hypothetical protein